MSVVSFSRNTSPCVSPTTANLNDVGVPADWPLVKDAAAGLVVMRLMLKIVGFSASGMIVALVSPLRQQPQVSHACAADADRTSVTVAAIKVSLTSIADITAREKNHSVLAIAIRQRLVGDSRQHRRATCAAGFMNKLIVAVKKRMVNKTRIGERFCTKPLRKSRVRNPVIINHNRI